MSRGKRDTYKYAGIALLMSLCLTGCGESTELVKSASEQITGMNYKGALETLEAAEQASEDMRLVERSKGIAYMGLTQYEDAVAAFQKSLSGSNGFIQDLDFDTNYYLAAAYTKLGRYEDAQAVYDAILALRSGQEDAYFLRGNVRINLGNVNEAIEDFDKTISLNPTNYDRLIEIYEVLANFGYKEAGQEYLYAALERNDKQMDNYVIGRIYYYLGEYQKACLALEEAREKGGVSSYLYLGKSYEATGDYNYAASVYNSYLGKYEPDARVYNQLGLCEMVKGDYRKALDAFQTGMQLDTTGVLQSLSYNEIVAYEYLGEFDRAKALMADYLSTYPDDETARRENVFLSTR